MVEPGEWDTDLDLGSYPPLQDMLARCVGFLPSLAGLPLDWADPLRVGLRPYRAENVRLEAEPGTRIVHNYGHGGAGVTLSWGCAPQQDLVGGIKLEAVLSRLHAGDSRPTAAHRTRPRR